MSATPPLPEGPLVAWYGDDFTGSAAVMEVLTFGGYPSVLFFDLPTEQQLKRFAGYRGIGVAGISRSMGPQWMDQHLPPVFDFLKKVGAPLRHYKTCSTLDSSPTVGSIGRAADLAMADDEWAPVIMGAPQIGRYQAFGNLFAQAGEAIHRLDRHPTMSVHPVTPMDESDVGLHLEKQTTKTSGLVDLVAIKTGVLTRQLDEQIRKSRRLITLDIVDEETLVRVGEEIWNRAAAGLFAIGSQGVEYALVAAWKALGIGAPDPDTEPVAGVDHIAVVSGSCSPLTEQQIKVAGDSGFAVHKLNPVCALDAEEWDAECKRAIAKALASLSVGNSPLICTAQGPQDPSIPKLYEAIQQSRQKPEDVNERIGVGLGQILRQLVVDTTLSRVVIAGGDSSSHGAQQLGLYAVTARSLVAPGAALLVGHSEIQETDGLEISLKGGQMGPEDYFVKMRDGMN